jgi:hypothetical protein
MNYISANCSLPTFVICGILYDKVYKSHLFTTVILYTKKIINQECNLIHMQLIHMQLIHMQLIHMQLNRSAKHYTIFFVFLGYQMCFMLQM